MTVAAKGREKKEEEEEKKYNKIVEGGKNGRLFVLIPTICQI